MYKSVIDEQNVITKKNIKLLVEALRSGKYSQTRGYLQDTDGHCCLGVACEIFIPKKDQERMFGMLLHNLPNHQRHCPRWLVGLNNDFIDMTGRALTQLNDTYKYTFDEIADCLEAVYLLEVLND